jgi:hypothetical protein
VQAIQGHIDTLDRQDGLEGFTDLPDLRSELLVLAKWVLTRMSREETISKVIEKEGHRLPELVDRMRDGISETGYAMTSAYLVDRGLAPDADADAVAVLLLGGLVNLRRSTWTFGAEPAGVSDDRAIAAWADIALGVLRRTGHKPRR